MKIIRTNAFKKDFQKLPTVVQEKFETKVRLFIVDIKHPSLRVKKMRGHKNRWEASIDMFYRFTFEIHRDYYLLCTLKMPERRDTHGINNQLI